MRLNHNKAYILGLFVGGGKINGDHFLIELPYKKWGMDPKRMNVIALDILQRIAKLFRQEYQIDIIYEIGNSKWFLKPALNASLDKLKNDLETLDLPTSGFLLNTANLKTARLGFKGVVEEHFLSGIFDSRASIALSHRRFSSTAPVVSIEVPASTGNFRFVVQLCSWLTDMGSITDQILYNHPNQHAGADPFYSQWKKGFKIRFLVKSFLAKHSFALQAKSIDIKQIEKTQTKSTQNPCPLRDIRTPSSVTVHKDIDSKTLPNEVRNKLFFHYFHFCAVLGCKHAPYSEVKKIIKDKDKLISFFPRLAKGTQTETLSILNQINSTHFANNKITPFKTSVKKLVAGQTKDYYGIAVGIAYLFSKELNGKRHKGSMNDIIKEAQNEGLQVFAIDMADNEPIAVINPKNNRGFIASNPMSVKNATLIIQKTHTNCYEIELK